MNLRHKIFVKRRGYQERTIWNYLTGTVPEDGWGMTVFNIVILAACIGMFVLIGRELSASL